MQTVTKADLFVDISESTTVSSAIQIANGQTIEAFIFPDITGTAVTFLAAMDGPRAEAPVAGQYLQMVNSGGTPIGLTIADNTWQVVDRHQLSGVRWLKIVFTTEQVADLTVSAVIGSD